MWVDGRTLTQKKKNETLGSITHIIVATFILLTWVHVYSELHLWENIGTCVLWKSLRNTLRTGRLDWSKVTDLSLAGVRSAAVRYVAACCKGQPWCRHTYSLRTANGGASRRSIMIIVLASVHVVVHHGCALPRQTGVCISAHLRIFRSLFSRLQYCYNQYWYYSTNNIHAMKTRKNVIDFTLTSCPALAKVDMAAFYHKKKQILVRKSSSRIFGLEKSSNANLFTLCYIC